MTFNGAILASIPFFPPCYLLIQVLSESNPLEVIVSWLQLFIQRHLKVESSVENDSLDSLAGHFTGSQLLAYVIVAIFGYIATDYLIPAIKVSNPHSFKCAVIILNNFWGYLQISFINSLNIDIYIKKRNQW